MSTRAGWKETMGLLAIRPQAEQPGAIKRARATWYTEDAKHCFSYFLAITVVAGLLCDRQGGLSGLEAWPE